MTEFDDEKLRAMEEMIYATSNALETLMQLLIDKNVLSEKELIDKMDELAEEEDVEEVGFDADAPREHDEADK